MRVFVHVVDPWYCVSDSFEDGHYVTLCGERWDAPVSVEGPKDRILCAKCILAELRPIP